MREDVTGGGGREGGKGRVDKTEKMCLKLKERDQFGI